MALHRSQLTRPWPCLRVLKALDGLQREQEVARVEFVCVWSEAVHKIAATNTRTFNHATATLLARKFVERCYYTGEGKRKKGGYRITAQGRAALAAGWSGKSNSLKAGQRPQRGHAVLVWQAMRIKGKFCADDLQLLCSTSTQTPVQRRTLRSIIARYIKALAAVGFIVPLGAAQGKYLLKRNSGPLPPLMRIKKRQVYDPNDGTLHDWEAV